MGGTRRQKKLDTHEDHDMLFGRLQNVYVRSVALTSRV